MYVCRQVFNESLGARGDWRYEIPLELELQMLWTVQYVYLEPTKLMPTARVNMCS